MGRTMDKPYGRRKLMNFEQTLRQLTRHIDDIWPQMNEEEEADFRRMMKRSRPCNPEFRAMWKKEANNAALQRRYANG